MKLLLLSFAAFLLCFNLVGCGGSQSDSPSNTPDITEPEPQPDPTPDPDPDPTPDPEPEPEIVTIHMIGDSTMTEYEEARRPQMGWGEQVSTFVSEETSVTNWARGGRSSRSFYYEDGRWNAVKEALTDGDYIIIQFGHNDQKYGGDYDEFGTYAYCSDGSSDGENCADAEHSYYQFLKKYVLEARENNATPILMTPIVRKYFSGTTITNKGQHNLESLYTGETFARGDYAAAMRAVATEYDVPLVDLTAETKTIVETYGNEAATESLYIAADSTHPQALFATLIAKSAMEGLKEQNILEANIVTATSLIASPDALAWGDRYVGVANVKKLTVSAFDLEPSAGSVSVTAPTGFTLSNAEDSDDWQSSYSIDYSNGAFTEKVFVKFNAAEEQAYTGNINFAINETTLGSVEVSGNGVAVGEGVASYSSWFTEGASTAAVSDGLVSAGDVNVVGLEAGSAKTLAVNGQDTSVARYKVFGPDLVSRNPNYYLEFSVEAASQRFYVDNITAWLTTSGGSTVQADIEYSMTSDFSNPVKLNDDPLSFSKDTMMLNEFGVTAQVPVGESIYVRVYPWNASGENSTGKYIAIYDLKISGVSGE